MKVVALKNIVQTGSHLARKDTVAEVPDEIGKEWIAQKFARAATVSEIKAAAEKPAA